MILEHDHECNLLRLILFMGFVSILLCFWFLSCDFDLTLNIDSCGLVVLGFEGEENGEDKCKIVNFINLTVRFGL